MAKIYRDKRVGSPSTPRELFLGQLTFRIHQVSRHQIRIANRRHIRVYCRHHVLLNHRH